MVNQQQALHMEIADMLSLDGNRLHKLE